MIARAGITLRQFFAEVYEPLRLRSASINSKRLYAATFSTFGRTIGREPLLDDLTDETVSLYLCRRRDNGISPYSIEGDRNRLLAIWRFACRRRGPDGTPYLADWPNVEAEKLPRRIPKAWTMDELRRMLDACKVLNQSGHTHGLEGGIKASLWWTALIRVLWVTGERIGAVRSLRWSDVDLDAGWVVMRAETRKGGREDKIARLDQPAIDALRAIRWPERAEVFPMPLSENRIGNDS